MLSAKVIRLNLSELYQHLNAESILQQMVDCQLIQPGKMKDVKAYDSKYAQNLSAATALFSTVKISPTFLLHLCDILDDGGTSQQRNLTQKLRSGLYLYLQYSLNFRIFCWLQIMKGSLHQKRNLCCRLCIHHHSHPAQICQSLIFRLNFFKHLKL